MDQESVSPSLLSTLHGGFRVTLFSALDGWDRCEEQSESGRPVQCDLGNVFKQSAMPHFDGLLLNHPRSPKNVRHAASVAIDRNGYVRLPGELDVRALELHDRFVARVRTDQRPSQGAVDRLRSVTRVLDLEPRRRPLRVPLQT